MIPYIVLSFSGGVVLGFIICHDLIKQELKTKTLRIGKRVYRVVHETGDQNEQSNLLRLVGRLVLCGFWCRSSFYDWPVPGKATAFKIRQSQAYR